MSKSKKSSISNHASNFVLPVTEEQSKKSEETSNPPPESKKSSCACDGGIGQCKHCKCGRNRGRIPKK
ncbi:MAG: hypothetical protein PHH83_02560 [Patescibacteria group bacterium]|nr:hypothetical protein [Patescibacteria group bacterium]